MLILLSLFITPGLLSPVDKEEGYFGLPAGSLKEPRFGITSDVYIADEKTIVLDKFIQNSRDPGCAALMIGPARNSDSLNKVGPGILLPFSNFDFSWEDDTIRKIRRRRSADRRIGSWNSGVTFSKAGNATTSSDETTAVNEKAIPEDASYEVIEYIDEDDDGVQKITVKKVLLKKEPNQVEESSSTEVSSVTDALEATTQPPTSPNFPTLVMVSSPSPPTFQTDPPMIIFNKKKNHEQKLAAKKVKEHMGERSLKPNELKKIKPTTRRTTRIHTSRVTRRPIVIQTPMLITATPTTSITASPPTTETETTHTAISTTTTTTITRRTVKKIKLIAEEEFKPTKFSTPESSNSRLAFILTNNGSISDYKWLAIWDQCSNKSVPHIWLNDIDPPHEEIIGALISLAGDMVSSGPVRILNCNTVLIENLFLEPRRKEKGLYFYAGAGAVDDEIRQKRARVVGLDKNQPIDRFSGDDVMVRLPIGTRTFDMDFISIFNEENGETLAYVELPSLLVPPCAA